MPRSARKVCESGMYHVMLRGINQQRIFEDAEDYAQFLICLRKYQRVCEYRLYAWCLMPNHIHLLIKPGKEPLGTIFRRMGASFVYWYNGKYGRSGHLFQDRYKSEPVMNESYFFTLIRYIHQNPVKAGLCETPGDYPYSSFARYFDADSMIDSETVLALTDQGGFWQMNLIPTQEPCMDISETPRKRLTDEQACMIMRKSSGCDSAGDFQTLPPEKRDRALKIMLKKGASIRQASRLTGVSAGVVRKFTGN